MKNSNAILPDINTDEEYENFKLNNSKLFKKIAPGIVTQHHLPDEPLSPLDGTNIVFSHGKSRVIKIFPPLHKSHFDNEVLIKQLVEELGI